MIFQTNTLHLKHDECHLQNHLTLQTILVVSQLHSIYRLQLDLMHFQN